MSFRAESARPKGGRTESRNLRRFLDSVFLRFASEDSARNDRAAFKNLVQKQNANYECRVVAKLFSGYCEEEKATEGSFSEEAIPCGLPRSSNASHGFIENCFPSQIFDEARTNGSNSRSVIRDRLEPRPLIGIGCLMRPNGEAAPYPPGAVARTIELQRARAAGAVQSDRHCVCVVVHSGYNDRRSARCAVIIVRLAGYVKKLIADRTTIALSLIHI